MLLIMQTLHLLWTYVACALVNKMRRPAVVLDIASLVAVLRSSSATITMQRMSARVVC